MTNPYKPPTTSETATPTERRFYYAGLWPIAILGIVIGGAIGGLIVGNLYRAAGFLPPALGWLGTTILLILMIRDSNLTFEGKLCFALLLPIPAYILYVPVCVVTSIWSMPYLGNNEKYSPSIPGAIVASAFAFFLVLMLIAVIVRANYQIRDHEAPTRLDE